MSVKFYPYADHLLQDVFRRACSEHCGILQSIIARPIRYSDDLNILSVSGQMPHYHKVLINPEMNMQYHLTGYGTYYEEAVIRLVGEAIERYALMIGHLLQKDRIAYASHRELRNRGKILPFEYVNLFTAEDYQRLENGMFRGTRSPTEDDVIGWVKCPSLFNRGEEIWMPLQLLFVGYRSNLPAQEVRFSPGFSTGTAAHVSLEKALANALLEFIEIDALMLHWYAKRKAPSVIINDPSVIEAYPDLLGPESRVEVRVQDIRALPDVRAHVFGTAIINKKNERPLIVYGAQGSQHPLKGMYRSFMESLAIEFLGIFGPLYLPEEYFTDLSGATYTDLDTNVAYWANADGAEGKRAAFDALRGPKVPLTSLPNFETGNTQTDLCNLISDLSNISEYAVYLDVTPPEVRSQGWYVMRAFVPELVTMCVPGVPYGNHPRWRDFGGIKNDLPHPLP